MKVYFQVFFQISNLKILTIKLWFLWELKYSASLMPFIIWKRLRLIPPFQDNSVQKILKILRIELHSFLQFAKRIFDLRGSNGPPYLGKWFPRFSQFQSIWWFSRRRPNVDTKVKINVKWHQEDFSCIPCPSRILITKPGFFETNVNNQSGLKCIWKLTIKQLFKTLKTNPLPKTELQKYQTRENRSYCRDVQADHYETMLPCQYTLWLDSIVS